MNLEDRLSIAQQIWDSVAADLEKQSLTAAQRAELEWRVAAADANPDEAISWETIRTEAAGRRER